MISGFFCHKANRIFVLFIRFAEYCLPLRVINKAAYIHQFRFPIIKYMPVAAAYARQKVFNFIYRFYTNVPEMAELKMYHSITQGLYIDLIVSCNGQHFCFFSELLRDGWFWNIIF